MRAFVGLNDSVVEGDIEAGKIYQEADFNKIIEIEPREAHRVKVFMEQIDQSEKTLVFCAIQDHALAVRDLINQIKTSTDPNYCQRVTSNDGALGEQHLRDFQDNEKSIPTILTTSQKLSTGVDARNVRNIVLMRPVNSIIEFKQIIGRGTRLYDGKDYFTVYDFVKAYHHFSDPEWDGEPVEPPDSTDDSTGGAGETPPPDDGGDDDTPPPRRKIKVKLADGKERTIQHMMATTFWSPDGTPMSAAEFVQKLFGDLPELFKDEDELRDLWGKPDTRKALLDALELGADWALDLHLHFTEKSRNMLTDYGVQEFCIVGSQAKESWFPIPVRYAKEDGADGVVRVSGCNLNVNYVRIEASPEGKCITWPELVREMDLSSLVAMPGNLTNLGSVMQAADIFVMSSLWEGLPLVLLEALAAGLPVAAYGIPGIEELLGGPDAGVTVPVSDVKALSGKLAELLGDEALRRNRGRSGRALIEREYSFTRLMNQLEGLYAAASGQDSEDQDKGGNVT